MSKSLQSLLVVALLLPGSSATSMEADANSVDVQPQIGAQLEPSDAWKSLRENFLVRLAALQRDFLETTDPQEAFALQRRIGALKLSHEIELHRLQRDRIAVKGPSIELEELDDTIKALRDALARIDPEAVEARVEDER